MKRQLSHTFEDIISLENLALAWQEFAKGKRSKPDVMRFEERLGDNLVTIHYELASKTYHHGIYERFSVFDPKPRIIHKAPVRDRLVHHALYRILYPFFDYTFIADSFSCRLGKGTHAALTRFERFVRQVSCNGTCTCWVLKCDIRKFFASIDQTVLLELLRSYIPDEDMLWLLQQVINSFSSVAPGIGLPLGNLTSQLLVNIYMNEFDQFVKHALRVKFYLRYADDFVLLGKDRDELASRIPQIRDFLQARLHLELHPDKIVLKTFASGVDWLGWVHFPHHRVLRAATKRRMLARVQTHPTSETAASYLGLLRHGNTFVLQGQMYEQYWLMKDVL